ncbi:hypothetical protein NVP1231O_13 [Vibrio phage 1.231.O._10N.261.49.F8]|nr:hypothetical protein NVP1119O_13 [Vibrio phage 1.119.O._10N.261.51.A9]AUR90385.1 hypothetical protein NVP1143O_13 [Vibrio phage 1.143.O._10N.261.55.C8]AUR96671.1 hypothetical protein NVP1231O_13 [Vibrio phage 1.231.O._10N.261.49.F8]
MKICEMMGTGSSSASKGMRNDAKKRDLIKRRQKKRNDIDDINSFMTVMASICPEYYGVQQ